MISKERTILTNQLVIMKTLNNLLGNLTPNGVGAGAMKNYLKTQINITEELINNP